MREEGVKRQKTLEIVITGNRWLGEEVYAGKVSAKSDYIDCVVK